MLTKLKQSDRRGFSVRSTGAIDARDLPTRSYKSRSHLEQYSGTAIRFGEFETLNFSIGILPEDIALFHALYRTSIKGRRDLVNILFEDSDDCPVQKIDNSYTSRVAEIFKVILKSLSIGLDFMDEDNDIFELDNKDITNHELDGKNYLCTDYQFFLIERMKRIREDVLSENLVMDRKDLEAAIEYAMKTNSYIMGPLQESLDDMKVSDIVPFDVKDAIVPELPNEVKIPVIK